MNPAKVSKLEEPPPGTFIAHSLKLRCLEHFFPFGKPHFQGLYSFYRGFSLKVEETNKLCGSMSNHQRLPETVSTHSTTNSMALLIPHGQLLGCAGQDATCLANGVSTIKPPGSWKFDMSPESLDHIRLHDKLGPGFQYWEIKSKGTLANPKLFHRENLYVLNLSWQIIEKSKKKQCYDTKHLNIWERFGIVFIRNYLKPASCACTMPTTWLL